MLSIGSQFTAVTGSLTVDMRAAAFGEGEFSVIHRINESGVTILLVQQNMKQSLAIAHRDCVGAQGRMVAASDAAALRENGEVRAAYFGKN